MMTITVEQSDGKIFDVERPVQKSGTVCIGGKFVTPELKDGKPYLFVQLPPPPSRSSRSSSSSRAAMTLLALGSVAALGFTERPRRRR